MIMRPGFEYRTRNIIVTIGGKEPQPGDDENGITGNIFYCLSVRLSGTNSIFTVLAQLIKLFSHVSALFQLSFNFQHGVLRASMFSCGA